MDEEWNVMEDLRFLFSKDATAQSCTGNREPFLDTTHSEGAVCQLKADVKKKKRIRAKVAPEKTSHAKQKREMMALMHQIAELENQLIEKRRIGPSRHGVSPWERAAREEFYARTKALQENAKLKLGVDEQAVFIDQMAQFLRRKAPTTMSCLNLSGYCWQMYRLPSRLSERIPAMHSIANRQFSRLEGAFINAGLYSRPSDLLRMKKCPQTDGKIIIEYAYHVKLGAPFRMIGAAVWKVLTNKYMTPWTCDGVETVEAVDPFTMYRTYSRASNCNAAAIHANLVFKYFVEAEREVIVWRSVLDDELFPNMRNGHVHEETGWMQISPVGPDACRLTLLVQYTAFSDLIGAASSAHETLKSAITLFEQLSFSEPTFEQGTFPTTPQTREEDMASLSFVKQTILRRGQRLEWMIETNINNVVKSYQGNPQSVA
ncbi:hypothetical protein AeMF1_012690 [Aphanomyces euteiches]|nr:hypothetical protein AeMF1_012690 [Aphanomyces euteiches]KAH9182008.1 hypothetical protein AeNC1_016018 [Aphanomyces euteiches]